MYKINYNIALIGFGGVNRALVNIISINPEKFYREMGLKAADSLEASGVMINDSSDFRFDAMPFGGYKRGSLGREGVRYAIQEMTQSKVICFNRK